MKNRIRLTESDLHRIVKECVRRVKFSQSRLYEEKLAQEYAYGLMGNIEKFIEANGDKPLPNNKNEIYDLIGEFIEYFTIKGANGCSIDLDDWNSGVPVNYGFNPETNEVFVTNSGGPYINKGIQAGGNDAVYVPSDTIGTSLPVNFNEIKSIEDLFLEIENAISDAAREGYETLNDGNDEEGEDY